MPECVDRAPAEGHRVRHLELQLRSLPQNESSEQAWAALLRDDLVTGGRVAAESLLANAARICCAITVVVFLMLRCRIETRGL